jgi:hypothetical protein
MSFISNILGEISGLFIDDGSLAVATVAVLGAVGAARYAGLLGSTAAAVLLCGGIAIVLLENVWRSTRSIKG